MIASMTAFGRTEKNTEIGRVIWEIRSVNHRYLEISLRLPDDLRMLENSIREHISGRINRGKIDCSLRYEPGENIDTGLSVNTRLVQSILESADSIWSSIPDPGKINPIEVLRWPGVINRETPDPEVVGGPLLAQLDKTLDIVIQTRQREGEKLKAMIMDRCKAIKDIVTDIKEKLPDIMTTLRERLQSRAEELQVDLDNERLEQEVVLLAQKYDVAEEMDRLETHIGEVLDVLERNEPVGRRLDFLMQELHREANTLGSKSVHYDCSNASVELKVLIEQMREQVQNIE
ncbi:MAG TPA: YicC/YloC family endoribonuclease [Gammaproteobacteria bacterium]|nr:YicC/YloC family endoribonuclease [Gammaproteobacteria bacterium]